MNKQEIYNKIKEHLLTQGKKSRFNDSPGSFCTYRGLDNTKCAVGCLIPDELYSPKMERAAFLLAPWPSEGCQLLIDALESVGIKEKDFTFIKKFQDIHDIAQPGKWKELLEKLAFDHDLEP